MRPLVITFLVLMFIASSLASAGDSGGCVGRMPISQLITGALPEVQRNEGHSTGGFVNNQHHVSFPVPEGKPRLDEPQYPVHSVLEFRFRTEVSDPAGFRARACAAVEEALVSTCTSVQRSDLVLTCSFRTEDQDRTGTVDLLPDSAGASTRILVVVASEW